MQDRFKKHLFICTNHRENDPQSSCRIKGGLEIQQCFKDKLKKLGLAHEVRANQSGCLDACAKGPTMVIYPKGLWYGPIKIEDVDEIIEKSIVGDTVIERLVLK